MLVVHGDNDRVIPIPEGRALARATNGTFVSIPDGTHLPQARTSPRHAPPPGTQTGVLSLRHARRIADGSQSRARGESAAVGEVETVGPADAVEVRVGGTTKGVEIEVATNRGR